MHRTTIWLLSLYLMATGTALAGVDATTVEDTVERIRSVNLDPARSVHLKEVIVDLAQAELLIEDGWLIPSQAVNGRTMELVFLGRSRFQLQPQDRIEAGQLELFTGNDSLDAVVDQAVLVIGNEEVVGRLFDGRPPASPDPETIERAETIFRDWVEGAFRPGLGAEAAILRAVHGDDSAAGFFLAWCSSPEIDRFHYRLDPDRFEQVLVGQFVEAEIGDHEAYVLEKQLKRFQRHGWLTDLNLEDLGDMDTWYSSSRGSESGTVAGGRGFEPVHFVLEVHLDPGKLMLRGETRIDLRIEEEGRKALSLDLYPDLRVKAVRDDSSGDLAWSQVKGTVTVLFPETLARGQQINLEIDYEGRVYGESEVGGYEMFSTTNWYPNPGLGTRATHDVTIHWPEPYQVLAAGRPAESGRDDEMRWQRWLLDEPTDFHTFELGRFEVLTRQVGHVNLSVGIARGETAVEDRIKEEVVATASLALEFYEALYGPYPLDHLTLVTTGRDYSQGNLGLITLSHILVSEVAPRGFQILDRESLQQVRTEIVAHEISHQWWGNKVGWMSYRDQWLSEALAEYSEKLFAFYRLGRQDSYSGKIFKAKMDRILEHAVNGRTQDSMGPIVLGYRLGSSISDDAYRAVIYDKGFMVLSMMEQEIGREQFVNMLGGLADAASGRLINTSSFIRALEKMSGKDFGPFADRFIYGTGIPDIQYDYGSSRAGDGLWQVTLRADMNCFDYAGTDLVKTEAGGWDAVDRYEDHCAGSTYALPISYLAKAGEVVDAGTVTLKPGSNSVQLELDFEPERVVLDPGGTMLARRMTRKADSVDNLLAQAAYLARNGLKEKAHQTTRQAVDLAEKRGKESVREQAVALFRLALHGLDMGEDHQAEESIARGQKILPNYDRSGFIESRYLARSRLYMRRGDYPAAFNLLKKHLRLIFLQREGESTLDQRRRIRWEDGRAGTAQEYALLAVAAHHTGNEQVCVRALEEAESRGADMSQLVELRNTPNSGS